MKCRVLDRPKFQITIVVKLNTTSFFFFLNMFQFSSLSFYMDLMGDDFQVYVENTFPLFLTMYFFKN